MCCRAPRRGKETRKQLEPHGGGSDSCRPPLAPTTIPSQRLGGVRSPAGHTDTGRRASPTWGRVGAGTWESFIVVDRKRADACDARGVLGGGKVPSPPRRGKGWSGDPAVRRGLGREPPYVICNQAGWRRTQPGRARLGIPRGHRLAGRRSAVPQSRRETSREQKALLLLPRLRCRCPGTARGHG